MSHERANTPLEALRDADPQALARLAYGNEPALARIALEHPSLPISAMQEVATRSISHWRLAALWRNPAIPEELFRIINASPNPYSSRLSLLPLSHPNCPDDILEETAFSPVARIRAVVAANPRMSESLASRLGSDFAPCVLIALARNPTTPTHVLEKLSGSTMTALQSALLLRQDGFGRKMDRELSRSKSTRVRVSVAKMTRDAALLGNLALDPEPLVRKAVKGNAYSPTSALVAVALNSGDTEPRLRMLVL